MVTFELDDLYLSLVRNGRARMTNDVADLAAEFPAWDFSVSWTTAASGPEYRAIWAWPLEGGPLTAPDAEEMRRKIRQARP